MGEPIERNLGEQPIAGIMAREAVSPQDLVRRSTEQITHKMVSRACKGRRLTSTVQRKIQHALNACTGKTFSTKDLFTY